MESYFLCDPFDIKEEDGGEVNNTFTVNGVVSISGIDWLF